MKAKREQKSIEENKPSFVVIKPKDITPMQLPISRAVTLESLRDPQYYDHILYNKGRLIGCGSTGEVYLASYKGQEVAAKISPQAFPLQHFFTEVYNSARFQRHPYILKSLVYSCKERCLITELMSKGSLGEILSRETLDWKIAIKIAAQIASALDYLHSVKNYVHGDIKSDNILVDEEYNAKLSDFETSRSVQTSVLTGTSGWRAPEGMAWVIKGYSTPKVGMVGIIGSQGTKMADIFSFGIFLIELVLDGRTFLEDYLYLVDDVCHGRAPFEQIEIKLQSIIKNLKEEKRIPVNFIQLAEACIQIDPYKRPTSQDIVSALNIFPELEGQLQPITKKRTSKTKKNDPQKQEYKKFERIRLKYVRAAEQGDVKTLMELAKTYNPDVSDFFGVTPLMIAAHKQNYEAVSYLLSISRGSSSLETKFGWTALRCALQNGDIRMAELLLQNGSDPDQLFWDGTTPLMLAARNGYPELIELLISKGAQIDYRHPEGFSALDSAIFYNQVESTLTLCKLGACTNAKNHPESRKSWPLSIAIEKGNRAIVEILLNHGATIYLQDHPQGATALHYAAEFGHLDIVQLLLEKDILFLDTPLAADTNVLLHFAKEKGVENELTTLLTPKGEMNLPDKLPGFTPLHLAAFFGHARIINELLMLGASMRDTPSGISALQLAEIMGNTEAANMLSVQIDSAEKKNNASCHDFRFFTPIEQASTDVESQDNVHGSLFES